MSECCNQSITRFNYLTLSIAYLFNIAIAFFIFDLGFLRYFSGWRCSLQWSYQVGAILVTRFGDRSRRTSVS